MLQLKLSRYKFPIDDYGRNVSFKIYDESGSAFDCSGYTPELIVLDNNKSHYIDLITPSWTTQSSGTGTFAFTETKTFGKAGHYFLEIQLTKSGEQTSTELQRITAMDSGVD